MHEGTVAVTAAIRVIVQHPRMAVHPVLHVQGPPVTEHGLAAWSRLGPSRGGLTIALMVRDMRGREGFHSRGSHRAHMAQTRRNLRRSGAGQITTSIRLPPSQLQATDSSTLSHHLRSQVTFRDRLACLCLRLVSPRHPQCSLKDLVASYLLLLLRVTTAHGLLHLRT